ncbi:hypothetical protein [Alkalihalobacillus sp. BA299]|uniref:hypothetical protein n=1 Tax=Alkalihalobacillus sp. BA299 TaxID=2815938 RepID=UPI001AD9E5B9|nr:hypothetical protein [Alkalihalobacillus sp. BA299]
MEQFRGDAHKFYKKIKNIIAKKQTIHNLSEINEINTIQTFYETLPLNELKLIHYRMIKEQNGSGMIPVLISILPWLGLIFSKQIQKVADNNIYFIFLFLTFFTLFALIFILLHYREKAWASLHIEIIKDIMEFREKNKTKW